MPSEQRHAIMVNEARRRRDSSPEPIEGGKINWKKVGRSIGNFAKPIIKEIAPIAKKAVLDYGKKALMDYMVPAAETAMIAAGRQRRRSGGATVAIQDIPKRLPGYRPKEHIPGHQVMDPNHKIYSAEKKAPKKISERSVLVKHVMKERGVGMIEASKIIKSEGLY